MKTRIVDELTQEKDIDWNKVQLLTNDLVVVISTGKHYGEFFKGTAIYDLDGTGVTVGSFLDDIRKADYKLCPPITIEFSND